MIDKMTAKTFQAETGANITTSNKDEIKMYRACGYKEIKKPKQIYAKGLQNGNSYLK